MGVGHPKAERKILVENWPKLENEKKKILWKIF